MCAALNHLSLLTSGPAGGLQAALFASPAAPPEPPVTQLPPQLLDDKGKLKCFNPKLDPSQREAVEFALRQQRLAIVHGPAGTGKTTTAVEVILQHVQRGQRVLACAPSNSAVDNLLQKLGNAGLENMIRLGHPARIEEDVLDFWIDKWVRYLQDDWDGRLAGDWKRQPGEIELKRKVIEEAHVVLCTLAIANARGPLNLTEKGGMFDLLVIDEASQALEAECWLAIPRAKKLLLFGDPKQLSPVVKTRSGEKEGLSISLMERQMNLHGAAATRQLEVQYRMHGLIQGWSAERHYGGLLQPDPSVARHRLCELEGVSDTADTGSILLLIDTAGCQLTESPPDETRSRSNVGEADLVAAHAAALAAAGLQQADMAVVTPYNLQTAVVRTALQRRQLPNVEVNTVGGFQGREKEAVLLSLVRSNKRRDIGFIGKSDLVNVAVTRARRHLCIVCDSNTASAGVELASLLQHMREKGEVRSARAYEAQLSPEALKMFRKGL
ncbi:DNA-binding protein SMUBP-2 [Amphibalanus amphitrite]|uniref:DNA-binding protein SMUBP-2 n=1 Tax=Amphibalanus amphitrite TaxID=1232801 RepID=A0A6A4W1W8_AMPAM|nr:DNA-binding protein SMUBP-2 [Amphibalanus amphitrite]